ncbi:MAG: MXAN_5187 C-terminal domain-containing protein [Acidobacteriota bacterium]
MAEPSAIDQDLQRLETELKRLEVEYNMFFAGRLTKPPWDTRGRVEALVKQYDRAHFQNFGDRFRFQSLQSRFNTFVALWDRGLRAREEGRPGPFPVRRADEPDDPKRPQDRILRVTTLQDPMRELDRLQELYESVMEARRESGLDVVPFQKFAELVTSQVSQLRSGDSGQVAFRVMVKDGKVRFTARALKGGRE